MADTQPIIVIAGILEDPAFVHISYVAESLSGMLPNFQFKRICQQYEEWESWLTKLCEANNWSHKSTPLVWREVGAPAGNMTYIGGATHFWEFIHEYYGIDSELTRNELEALKQDYVQEFQVESTIDVSKSKQRNLNVAVFGGNKSLWENLVADLFLIEKLHLGNGMKVKLYHTSAHNSKVTKQTEDIEDNSQILCTATVVETLSAALINCDILIILDEILRENEETTDSWLNRNRKVMLELAAQINDSALESIKVLFSSAGPTCFNAGVLAVAATKLHTDNIVVVSSHQGLEVLYEMLDSVGVEVDDIGCPPVWGFLGINHFVDICNAIHCHEIFRPNNRALRPPKGTTLSLGTKRSELRSIFYTMHDKNSPISSSNKREVSDILKCEAICDVLRLWYGESSDNNGEIISLGLCSNGAFGIWKGLFFSQPAYVEENENGYRFWVPYKEFPMPNIPDWSFDNLIESSKILVERLIHPN